MNPLETIFANQRPSFNDMSLIQPDVSQTLRVHQFDLQKPDLNFDYSMFDTNAPKD